MIIVASLLLTAAMPTAVKPSGPPLSVLEQRPLGPGLRVKLLAVKWGRDSDRMPLEDLRLTVEKRRGRRWIRAGNVPAFRPDDSECDEAKLFAGDFDGDGRMEMAVNQTVHCASRWTGAVAVFRWDGRKLRTLGTLSGDEGAEAGDLNRDGKWEARVYNDVGQSCHALQARWPDHYAVKGDKLVRVNPSFPRIYARTREDIVDLLGRAPWDDSLWAVYARASRYARVNEAPRKVYLKVARLARANLKTNRDGPDAKLVGEAIGWLRTSARRNEPISESLAWYRDAPRPYRAP